MTRMTRNDKKVTGEWAGGKEYVSERRVQTSFPLFTCLPATSSSTSSPLSPFTWFTCSMCMSMYAFALALYVCGISCDRDCDRNDRRSLSVYSSLSHLQYSLYDTQDTNDRDKKRR